MELQLNRIKWTEQSQLLDKLWMEPNRLTVEPLGQGLEGEVLKLCDHEQCYALKVWNKYSDPNVRLQYDVLRRLAEYGIPVSNPIGYGKNDNNQTVLLTSYDGEPLTSLDKAKIEQITNILTTLHCIEANEFIGLDLPQHDFLDYFFPEINIHPDLYESLQQLLEKVDLKHSHIIHGDYHLQNMVEQQARLTIIDWTNVQLGDIRYDFAWSYFLQKLYISDKFASLFYNIYLERINIEKNELELFEAFACIRWILLSRSGGVPLIPQMKKKISNFIAQHSFLQQFYLAGYPKKMER